MGRNASLDLLKIFMAFAVVGIHAHFLNEFSPNISYFFTQVLFRMAVPIFFMINGYYFYQLIAAEKPIFPLIKHLSKLYLIWSFVYLYFMWPVEQNTYNPLIHWGRVLIYGYSHLWYVPATIEAAMLMYIIKNISDKYKIILIFFSYGMGLFIEYSGTYHLFAGSVIDRIFNVDYIYRNFLFFGFPMFSLGFLISKYHLNDKYTLQKIITLLFFGLFLLIFEVMVNLYFSGDKTKGFDLLFSLLILSPALFILVLKSKWITTSKTMSDISTIIYFIHPLFISFVLYLGIKSGTTIMFLVIGLSVLSSLIIIPLNKKVKIFL
jgi:surface polysaccharide O-acyltransferase-like enzyme